MASLALVAWACAPGGREPRDAAESMGLLLYLILLAFLGFITGGLARLLLPGRDPMTVVQTIALGLAGSFIAGLVAWAIFGHGAPGLVLSVVCSSLILYFIRRSRGGGLARPAGPQR